ncbi:hypothetical protein FV232_24905 [Methylobacterium sp. WL30]|nr:MAG: hypothetical protein EOO77_06050 [Oxalobacteraceae bacterium]TXN40147.1 hypothetical protein FV225_07230 [Methylobacterium sp. WL93]TXN49392.1 hypothetical protein FV227_16960 [Methylobacterium sp. WL119]TXN62689.1 hypothetical protein FV232_24905 [Methylobacterium sp. WL30]
MTTKDRTALPKKDFALPDEQRFPVEDKAHARNAKARAAQSEKAGNLLKSDKAAIPGGHTDAATTAALTR